MDKYLDELQKYKSSHRRFFQQPIVKAFLEHDEYLQYVKEAITHPTTENVSKVDQAFKVFYAKAKIISYLSKLIYFNSIHFDKRKRKDNFREPLVFDQPLSDSNSGDFTVGERLYSYHPDLEEQFDYQSIEDIVESPRIYQALNKLTEKQKEILKLYYVDGLKNKEIAQLKNDSPQNISQQHKRALITIKKELKEVKDRE